MILTESKFPDHIWSLGIFIFFNRGSGYEKSKVNYKRFKINMLFFTPIQKILMGHSVLELPLMAFQLCHCINSERHSCTEPIADCIINILLNFKKISQLVKLKNGTY